jgi:glycosyltransferase involved in cell wall biosynthesis
VGIDLDPHEKLRRARALWSNPEPVLLWNHRWEYDKDPDSFVSALLELKSRGVSYRVVICGQSSSKGCPAFERAVAQLGERILHLGFFPEPEQYRQAVASCDVVVSTARHEFFGVSVVEAVSLGCLPVLPRALSYPELIPPHLHPFFLYRDPTALADFLEQFLRDPPLEHARELEERVKLLHWRHLAPELDRLHEELRNQSQAGTSITGTGKI